VRRSAPAAAAVVRSCLQGLSFVPAAAPVKDVNCFDRSAPTILAGDRQVALGHGDLGAQRGCVVVVRSH
jgi:hypothetical protein